jgi:uncharacterized protein DUF4145
MANLWTCPYCNRPCTVGETDVRHITGFNYISEEYGSYTATITVVVCPNAECREQTMSLSIYKCSVHGAPTGKPIFSWQLVPESEAKPFPDYIPEQLRDDYAEACLIKDKSPKASATLSRRCLQGMIRDFWDIKKGRLIDEIAALEEKVDAETWKAIDAVRHVGNIGAHMEKDVNLIIDVDGNEAGLLIWLIETLFEEWYVAQHDRDEKMQALAGLASKKQAAKSAQKEQAKGEQ